MKHFLPGAEDEYDRVGPLELERDMQKIAGWFRPEPVEEHLSEVHGSVSALAATAPCMGCGRTLISVVHREASRFIGYCGRCKPFSSEGNVDHAEWLRRRRGLA